MAEHYKYFQNRECEFFPCHKGADESDFNCLFCYCPLYALGHECGGNFRYLENGIKSCENCMIPHKLANYEFINGKFGEIAEMMREHETTPANQTK